MRTTFIVAASALIAVAVLVATAGPGTGTPAGTIEPLDPSAFTRLAPPPLDPATTISTPGLPQHRPDPAEPIVDGGRAPAPTGRPDFAQPRPAVGVVVKPTPAPAWGSAEYSWYGPGFYGSGTACGQTYSKTLLGVAHKTLPCGTRVTFRNPTNGKSITVSVIDRGPYVAGRMWDLSYATCSYLGNCYTGTIQYRIR